MVDERKYSSRVVDGIEQAPSRAMLYPTGFKKEDFSKPQIGVASLWSMVTPCNMHINHLADRAVEGADSAGGKGILFNTITVSDGISMGTPGMRFSLVSREVIADSIETVVCAQGFDGFVAIGGCDKNMPACGMPREQFQTLSCRKLKLPRYPGRGHAAACIPPTPWRHRWKPWVCLYPIALHKTRLAKPNFRTVSTLGQPYAI